MMGLQYVPQTCWAMHTEEVTGQVGTVEVWVFRKIVPSKIFRTHSLGCVLQDSYCVFSPLHHIQTDLNAVAFVASTQSARA